jgi:hypothetical protein
MQATANGGIGYCPELSQHADCRINDRRFKGNQLSVLHRQGKNLETTTNKRLIHVTVNGDSQSEQQSASMLTTKLSKAGDQLSGYRLHCKLSQITV